MNVTANDEGVSQDVDGIDLRTVCRAIWGAKYYLIIGSVIGVSLAIVVALTATPMYRAEIVVAEAQGDSVGGAASLAAQLGGLASLAGVNIGKGGANLQAKAVLESRQLIEEFITRNSLLPDLASQSKEPPKLWFAVRRFQTAVLSMRDDIRKNVIIISVKWTDPVIAARWANSFVALANEYLRTQSMDEAKRNITYLNSQIAATSVVDLQRVLYGLVENETRTLMLANGRTEFAFKVIDPAVPPQIRYSPQRTVIVIVGLIFGLSLGGAIAFLRSALAAR